MSSHQMVESRGLRFAVLRGAAALLMAVVLGTPGARGDEPLKISRTTAMGLATSRPAPDYPAIAKQLRVEGEVEVQVTIGEDGKVEAASALSGNPVLTKSAVDTVKEWKFKPYQVEGKTVKVQTTLNFAFKLDH